MQLPEVPPTNHRRGVKQRALNALVILLAVAVTVQGYLLWDLHSQLGKAMSQIERNGLAAETNSLQRQPDLDRQHAAFLPAPDPTDPADPNASNDPYAATPFAQQDPNDWDPFREMDRMRKEMDRVFGQMQSQDRLAPQVGGVSRTFRTRPFSVDDQEHQYVITVSLPGADEADISVSVENQVLKIIVQHNQTVQNQTDRRERVSGRSEQHLPLPEPVDGSHLKSSFKDGILTVTIPKSDGTVPERHIEDPSQSVRGN